MRKDIRHIGLDVDSAQIAVAVAEPDGGVRSLGSIPYRAEAIRGLVKRLGPAGRLRVCYEAGRLNGPTTGVLGDECDRVLEGGDEAIRGVRRARVPRCGRPSLAALLGHHRAARRAGIVRQG